MNILFDSFVYTNRLRQVRADGKVLFSLAALCLALVSHTAVHLLLLLWMSIWITVYARIPLAAYLRLLVLPAAFLLMSMPALCIEFVGSSQQLAIQPDVLVGHSLFDWYVYLSQAGLHRVFEIFFRSLAAVACVYFLLLTVPFTEVLHVMRKSKCPTVLVELLLVMYRFVFVLLATAEQLWTAQQSRGGHAGFRQTLHDVGRLVVQLFTRTWLRYTQLSVGLLSRGFTGDLRVISFSKQVKSPRYTVEAITGCLLLATVETWMRS